MPQDCEHLFQLVNTILEVLGTGSFPRELTLASDVDGLVNWQTAHNCDDIVLLNEAVVVKVVNVKYELLFFIKGRAVK